MPPAAAARAVAAAVPAATDWATFDESDAEDDEPVGRAGSRPAAQPAASPNRRKWIMAGALAAGVGVGSIMWFVMYNLVSGTVRSTMDPEGQLAAREETAPSTVAANTEEPTPPAAAPGAKPAATPSPAVSRHRETVDDLIRAYNQIADGYARIRDTSSIAAGRALVARGAVQLRASAHRGKTLPALSPAERKALIQQSGPPLLRAIDRVLDELRRLQATDGIRSDFDRLIDAYTRSREQVQREVDAG